MTVQERWYEEVWNQGRESSIDDLLDENIVSHGLASLGRHPGVAGFKVYFHALRGALSDLHVVVEQTVSEGDLEVARCVVTALHTGTGLGKEPLGKPVQFTGMSMCRVKDGKIVEAWNNFDFATMYQQME